MSVGSDDFPNFFRAVHGHAPFRWQVRLLREVLEHGWRRAIDLPTASGKTAVLDVAVMALAIEASKVSRHTPRRIALVVDRRIVVDDAARRAARISQAVGPDASEPILVRVREALLSLGGERALDQATMRGGIYREDRWARTPLQPVILCSTVDQVGSRLLHRGYGLSNHAWPIHAGLLGQDSLIILDEAHCSQPFLQTMTAIASYRSRATEPMAGPWAAIAMTATPPSMTEEPFRLSEDERAERLIAQRIGAAKPARLERIAAKGARSDEALAMAIVERLRAPATVADQAVAAPGLTTLVVVNRVRVARLIFDELRELSQRRKGGFGCHPLLLTGRSRSLERDALLVTQRDRLLAGRDRAVAHGQPPLIVVATQCIEVGADLDADALVTEACPLDSLRQRFGRLDRLGERHALGMPTPALILARSEQVGDSSAEDPIYSDRLARTWAWLHKQASDDVVDCGVAALEARDPPLDELAAPRVEAPTIFPVYCDLWVQTGPEPAVSPDPAIFLHGLRSGPADVQIVWRADLDPEQPETWAATIAASPPVSGEALPLPLHLARAYLAAADDQCKLDSGGDIEGEPWSGQDEHREGSAVTTALRWAGPEQSVLITEIADVHPGATLILSCADGGADCFGWTGKSGDVPRDLFEVGRIAARRPPLLRIHPRLAELYWGGEPPSGWNRLANLRADLPGGLPSESEMRTELLAVMQQWHSMARGESLGQTLAALCAEGEGIRVAAHPSGMGLVISGRRRLAQDARDFSDEDDASSLSPQGLVRLDAHLRDVRDWGHRIAETARLPGHLVDAVARAGHLHDLGKADPRFQAWLLGGDRLRVDRERLLAKSDRVRLGAAARTARERSGYPKGARHELLSVRLAESAPDLLPAEPHLRDLVLHLVASHHGRCRPWAPAVVDERAITVRYLLEGHELSASSATGLERLDSGVAERFWRLIRHFGWWGLSYLEACLRLADHRASETPGKERDA